MNKLTINPNNRKWYLEDFIKGFECGVERQFEKDKAELTHIVHGKWLKINEICEKTDTFECSNCGEQIRLSYYTRSCDYRCCPYCFCKMDGKEVEE